MASTYLSRTQSTPTSTRIATFSFWCKRSSTGSYEYIISTKNSGSTRDGIAFSADDDLDIRFNAGSSSPIRVQTSRKFRDPSGFYHILVALDTTQATASNRVKIYVNGVQETSMVTSDYPSQNYDFSLNATSSYATIIGKNGLADDAYFNGLLTHFHGVDGTAYDASTFGESDSVSGIWKPKTSPSVTYGSNGFFLKFENSGAMGTDSSGNSNTFAVGGGTLTQNVDTPSNNFATLNTLVGDVAGGYTIINGNLSVTANTGDAWRTMYGTLASSKGKFYFEQKIDNASGTSHYVGVSEVENMEQTNTNGFEDTATSAYCYRPDGGRVSKDSLTAGWGASWTAGDIIGTAIDIDNLKIYFSKNGVWQASGDPTSGATGTGSAYTIDAGKTYTAATATYNTQNDYSYNFGQGYFGTTAVASAGTAPSEGGIFEFDCPSGYQSLSVKGINSF